MFGRTSAYRALRAQDKRTTIEFRHELGKMALLPTPSKRDLVDLLKPFVEFVGSLRKVNNREILIAHDRELWASCGVLLEQAEQTLGRDPAAAAEILHGAATAAQGLYGREAALDVFLRKVRKTPLTAVAGPALKQELDNFRELLSNLPMI